MATPKRTLAHAAPQRKSDIEYRDIPGFPGYQVGIDGTIWSSRSNREFVTKKWKCLTQFLNNNKYPACKVRVNKKNATLFVHRALLLAFVGPPSDPSMQACHFPDPNPLNISLSNLRWATAKENVRDSMKNGTFPRGSRCGTSKLDEDAVREIVRLHRNGMTQKAIAERFSVVSSTICQIIRGRSWTHVTESHPPAKRVAKCFPPLRDNNNEELTVPEKPLAAAERIRERLTQSIQELSTTAECEREDLWAVVDWIFSLMEKTAGS